jgi:hypothetical protein
MRDRRAGSRTARLSLLLAALLYLAGGALGPWTHGQPRYSAPVPTLSADHHSSHLPLGHNDLACPVAQALDALAAPASASTLPLLAGSTAAIAFEPPPLHPAPRALRPQARAPPLA